jgi:hypothetical protein
MSKLERHVSIYEDNTYLQMNESWHVEDSPWKAKQIVKLIHDNKLAATTYCEIGCGAGEILVNLYNMLPENTYFAGFDISPQLKEQWDKRKRDRITFHQGDFLEQNDYFDVLLLIDVVEHIEDYMGFLKQIKHKGLYKIFNFPLEIFVLKAFLGHKFVESRKKYGHIHYFNKDICLATLEDLGFEVIDFFYGPSAIDLCSVSTSISTLSKMLKIPRILLSKISIDLTAKVLGGYSLFVLAQ